MSVMIVEDEALVALVMQEILTEAGFTVCGLADTPDGARALDRGHAPHLAVIDVRLAAGEDGITLAASLAASRPIGILFATGNPGEVRARARVGHGCLAKPFEAAWLIAALRAIERGAAAHADIPAFFPLSFSKASPFLCQAKPDSTI